VKLIDRYILRLTLWPLAGALGMTLAALLLERILKLLQVLSESSNRFGFVAQLAANLVPHYLGLTLPAAFFIALFVVIARLNEGSEIDALLASGVSLTRVAAPYLALWEGRFESEAEAWEYMARTWPNYKKYEERTDRQIKVFLLTPR